MNTETRTHRFVGLMIAYTALFGALGGTAVALPGRNTVDKNDLRNGAVTTRALGNGAVTTEKLGANSVSSASIGLNQVTGDDVDESTFKGLIRGNGTLVQETLTADQVGFLPAPFPVLVDVPTFGKVELIFCGNGVTQGNQIRVRLLSNDDATEFVAINQVTSSGLAVGTGKGEHIDLGGGTFATGGGEPLIAQAGTGGVGLGLAAKWDFTMWRDSGSPRAAHVTVSGLNGLLSGEKCRVSAQGEIYD